MYVYWHGILSNFIQWTNNVYTITSSGKFTVTFPILFTKYKFPSLCMHSGSTPVSFVFLQSPASNITDLAAIVMVALDDINHHAYSPWSIFTVTIGY